VEEVFVLDEFGIEEKVEASANDEKQHGPPRYSGGIFKKFVDGDQVLRLRPGKVGIFFWFVVSRSRNAADIHWNNGRSAQPFTELKQPMQQQPD
jgi:hypothetical protein